MDSFELLRSQAANRRNEITTDTWMIREVWGERWQWEVYKPRGGKVLFSDLAEALNFLRHVLESAS